jgi:hypothetical protein
MFSLEYDPADLPEVEIKLAPPDAADVARTLGYRAGYDNSRVGCPLWVLEAPQHVRDAYFAGYDDGAKAWFNDAFPA